MKIPFKNMSSGWRESPKYTMQCNTCCWICCVTTLGTGQGNLWECPFGYFCHFWISDCMSHVWKCRSYNSYFCASRGQILSPRRKLSQMKKEKKNKTKKRKRNQNIVQQKANLNPHTHRAIFRMHGWVNLAGLCLTGKAKFVVWPCVCVWFCEK